MSNNYDRAIKSIEDDIAQMRRDKDTIVADGMEFIDAAIEDYELAARVLCSIASASADGVVGARDYALGTSMLGLPQTLDVFLSERENAYLTGYHAGRASLASASTDAEKGFEEWATDEKYNLHKRSSTKPYYATDTWHAFHGWKAGHAAATAAMQAEVDALRTELDAMCGEVERCWEWMANTVDAELTEVGIYRDDPQTTKKFEDCMQRQVIALRPPRVTEILAERKEQSNETL